MLQWDFRGRVNRSIVPFSLWAYAVACETVAAIPAEISRPTRKVSGGDLGDPILACVVLVAFVLGLYMLAKGILTSAALLDGQTEGGIVGWLAGVVMLVLGSLLVFAPLIGMATHPRTRTAGADFAFMAMKALMFVAGMVCLAGGMLGFFRMESPAEEIGLGVIATLFVLTPVILQLAEK